MRRKRMLNRFVLAAMASLACLPFGLATAADEGREIAIGITLSTTGPAAALAWISTARN
jgi:hypothetical protein